ncbi:MAG: hypothetical protein WAP49_12835 [Mycobacterium sp.]
MRFYRFAIPALALIGAVFGALLGIVLTPDAGRYKATGDVAFLPAANLTIIEASNFWEVLTRGQVSRTAAVVYDDPRWLPSAANAAKVSESELTLSAAAVPETTIVAVTVQAPSPEAAEAALNDVLTTATAEVASLAAPYSVRVLWPAEGSAVPLSLPGRAQIMAAGGLAGILVGGGTGWYLTRRVRIGQQRSQPSADPLDDRALRQP